ncbi:YceD family protein [Cupriavidus sp. H18C2]|uniref:YceD family protein n=1 Tax=Cupriavidus sp. H18C2 TaxID=3241602 RepID=UPI003BF7E1F1
MSQPTQPAASAVAFDLRETDLFVFCRKGGSVAGEVPVRDLPRILAETAADAPASTRDEAFAYTLAGFAREEAAEPGAPAAQRLFVEVTVNGRVWLDCQRCLGVYAEPIATKMCFEVVASEAAADEAPMDDDELDVIVGSKKFSALELIEDEVLLALPTAPKHVVCPTVHESLVTGADGEVEPEAAPEEEKRPSPFAALAGLKTRH